MNDDPARDPALPEPGAALQPAATQSVVLPPSTAVPSRSPVADVYLAFVVAMFAGLLGIVVVMAALVIVRMSQGHSPESIQAWLTARPAAALVLTNLPFQLACLAVAFLWRWHRGPITTRRHLGLISPALSPRQWLFVLVAVGVPFAVSLLAASAVPTMQSENTMTEAWSTMGPFSSAVWIIYIGVAPGICEELLFRGLILRRMLRRWGPMLSITLSSILFAIAHVDPPAMALAFTLGIWLGYLAWRTGSILPSIATHVTVNSLWNLGQITTRQAALSEATVWTISGIIFAASGLCFILTIKLLSSRRPPALGETAPASVVE